MVCAAPEFDPAQAPADPTTLFVDWLLHAIDAGVTEPHAMTVSTVSGSQPSARVLILKDVDDDGWHFAVSTASRKGAELAHNPAVALTFYWPTVGRQIRVDRSPGLVPADWVSYAVRAERVEFWQADLERRHRRLRYEREDPDWVRILLWP